jgi:hypothetical protein
MLIFLFKIGISILTLPPLAIVCIFIIIALNATTTPRVVLQPLSSPEEWNQTITEMGLEELDNINPLMLMGNYRNHRVTISEYTYRAPPGADESVYHLTNYDVEFKNSAGIMMYMTERFPLGAFQRLVRSPSYASWQREHTVLHEMTDIRVGDDKFDRNILLKGNREGDVTAILDQSIRDKIISVTFPRFNLTIDEDNLDRASHHVVGGFSNIKKEAQRFRTVIDLMIDIVEKIESYTP